MSYVEARPPRSNFGMRGVGENAAPSFAALKGDTVSREGDARKRTMAIALAVCGAGAVGIYMFGGASAVPAGTPQIFASVGQCVSAGAQPAGTCEAQWNEANRVHDRGAPAYANMAQCETVHGSGKCVKPATPDDPERAQKYIPMMSGYFFGQTANGLFKGVPLYTTVKDGNGKYHIAEVRPKVDEFGNPVTADSKPREGQRVMPSILFIPAIAAPAANAGAAAARSAATGAAAGAAAAAANPAANAAPRAATPAAGAAPAARGGFGASASAAGAGKSGG